MGHLRSEATATPFLFITTYPIKEGRLDPFKVFVRALLEVLEASEPRAVAINAYLSADGTEAAIVQLTSDAESINRFWRVVHQHTGRALGEYVDSPTSIQMYGAPGDLSLHRTRHTPAAGVTVTAMPEHLGGFTRPQPDG